MTTQGAASVAGDPGLVESGLAESGLAESPLAALLGTPLVVRLVDRATLVVTGEDRRSWLQGLLTCGVAQLEPGQGRWGLALTKTGKVLGDLDVVAAPEALLLGVPRERLEPLREAFERLLVAEDVELEEVAERLVWVAVHGAGAPELAARAARAASGQSASMDWTGAGAAALVVAEDELERCLEQLCADGVARLATPLEAEQVRLAAGIPRFGVDYDERRTAHELGLERRAVDWTKGCYLGQEVVCMQDMRGKVRRRLATLRVHGAAVPERGSAVQRASGGEVVGAVTSAVAGPGVDGALAMALLEQDAWQPGTRLRVGADAAVVVDTSQRR